MHVKKLTQILMKGVASLSVGLVIYLFIRKDHSPSDYNQFDNYSNLKSGRHIASSQTQNGNFSEGANLVNGLRTQDITHSSCDGEKWVDGLPVIYMITPTYRRAEQIPELTRTAQTLSHVKNLVWIVAEDAPVPSQEVLDYLAVSGLRYVYLRAQMPDKFAGKNLKKKPRGVANRNAGIEWVRKNASTGVVYFGDDDNTYDLRIFEEMRYTKKVSMFPVGLVTQLGVSTPIVRDGKVVGFFDGWTAKRKFPVDMAGFAVNVKLLLEVDNPYMPYIVGYEEDGLLKNLHIAVNDIEPKAENCTKIWVWHTQTHKNGVVKDKKLGKTLEDTNLKEIVKVLWRGV